LKNIALSLRRRINIYFVYKVDILLKIIDYLVFILLAIILPFFFYSEPKSLSSRILIYSAELVLYKS
jgi:hypothetical protein